MEKKKYFLDIAHMHPVCPLSLSHARIFVLADVWARWKRKQGFSVRFPICMHYSGSTVFKITNAVSNFLQNRELNDTDQKTLDLIFNFYKIPREHLHQFTEPISVLNYFSDVILKDLRSIQVSCDYNDYFNTTSQWYQEFVRSVFDIYTEKSFITTRNRNKSLNYPNQLFRDSAVKRLNETGFSPLTAKAMVADSLEKLNGEWSYERENSVGTEINKRIVDPQFDSEFLSIFNSIYPHLKDLDINEVDAPNIFRGFFHKINDPDGNFSPLVEELYSKILKFLPANLFLVERHLQNWVAKRIYTETILLTPQFSTGEYFFLGSITVNGKIDSASRGRGLTLSQLIQEAGPINARISLLYTFGNLWRDFEWTPSFSRDIRQKTWRFIKFYKLLRIRSVEKNFNEILTLLNNADKELENNLYSGSIRQFIHLLFDELPKVIYPLTEWQDQERNKKGKEQILNFFLNHFEILCPVLKGKLYEN
jgi:leucyl-tRNA synthetase